MKKGHGIFAVFLVFVSYAVSPAISANLTATPGLSIEERWDSNILNASTNEDSDFITRVAPFLTLGIETRQARLNLMGGFEYEYYASHTELNEGAAAFFGLSTSSPLHFTPRLSLTPTIRFVESNDPVRRVALTQSAIEGLPPSEAVVTARTKSREYAGSLQLAYRLTPNVDIGVGGGGRKRTFQDDNASGVDSETVFGNGSASYRFTPRFSSGIHVRYSRYSFENDTDSSSYNSELMMRYLVSEHYTVEARGGVSYLTENVAERENTYTSPSGQLSLTYNMRDFKAVLHGYYRLSGGGTFGLITRRGDIKLTLSDQFAQGWWWDLSGFYQINQSLETPRKVDVSTWHGMAGLRYQPAEWASIRLAGSHVRQRSHNSIEGEDLDRNSIFLAVDLSSSYRIF